MGKIVRLTSLFKLGIATDLVRKKTEFKPIVDLDRNGLFQDISAQDTLHD